MRVISSEKLGEIYGDKVIFIFPSSILGGHELMAIEIIKDFLKINVNIDIYIEPNNKDLKDIFDKLSEKITKFELPFEKRRLESISAFFDPVYMYKVRKFIKENFQNVKNQSVIIVQGDIEIGSSYVVAAKDENIKIISYIPFTHTKKKMNKRFFIIRDFLDSKLYKLINNYITIYNDAAKDLVKYNNICNVDIIKNKVRDLSVFKKLRINRIKNNKIKIYIIGRIEFLQKGQDQLLDVIKMLEVSHLRNIELNIIGDGPDSICLSKMLSDFVNLEYKFHGWSKEPWSIAYDADLLIIPSNFEGVPLVMLEALDLQIPILAKKIDGMKDYLSSNNLYSCDFELRDKLSKFIENEKLNKGIV